MAAVQVLLSSLFCHPSCTKFPMRVQRKIFLARLLPAVTSLRQSRCYLTRSLLLPVRELYVGLPMWYVITSQHHLCFVKLALLSHTVSFQLVASIYLSF